MIYTLGTQEWFDKFLAEDRKAILRAQTKFAFDEDKIDYIARLSSLAFSNYSNDPLEINLQDLQPFQKIIFQGKIDKMRKEVAKEIFGLAEDYISNPIDDERLELAWRILDALSAINSHKEFAKRFETQASEAGELFFKIYEIFKDNISNKPSLVGMVYSGCADIIASSGKYGKQACEVVFELSQKLGAEAIRNPEFVNLAAVAIDRARRSKLLTRNQMGELARIILKIPQEAFPAEEFYHAVLTHGDKNPRDLEGFSLN